MGWQMYVVGDLCWLQNEVGGTTANDARQVRLHQMIEMEGSNTFRCLGGNSIEMLWNSAV